MNVEPWFLMLLCKIYGSFGTLGNPEPLRSDRLSNATRKPQTVLYSCAGEASAGTEVNLAMARHLGQKRKERPLWGSTGRKSFLPARQLRKELKEAV
jgi:hypothetical protein